MKFGRRTKGGGEGGGEASRQPEIVKWGNAAVRIVARSDGRWHLRWRDGGRERTTTAQTREKALARGREIAKGMATRTGTRAVSHAEAEAVDTLRRLAPDQPPASVAARIEDCARRLGSWEAIERAVAHYEAAGIDRITPITAGEAIARCIDFYRQQRAKETAKGITKELRAFAREPGHADLEVSDLSPEILGPWIGRGNPAPRFFNNRHATWATFFSRCKQWGHWPAGLPSPVASIERARETVRAPAILSVAAAAGGLGLLVSEAPELVPYFLLGGWAGLRPSELLRIRWGDFDWSRGFLHVRAEVAQKTLQERWVPLEKNIVEMLPTWTHTGARRKRADDRKVCGSEDALRISAALRGSGLIETWPLDVLRHSYISYRIARGDSLARIAEEAGNSEGIIRRRYRRPVMAPEGAAWFAIGLTPASANGAPCAGPPCSAR